MRGKSMENAGPVLCAPSSVSVTVRRPTRPREDLTEREIEKLIKAAAENRWGHRDATALLIAYRHGLRLLIWLPCAGTISTSRPGNCTFGAPRAARPAFTRSEDENYEPCGGSSWRHRHACLWL